MIKIGDHVEYNGIYSKNFPHVGVVEKIENNRVTIRLDESITHINVSIKDIAFTEEEAVKFYHKAMEE